MTSLVELPSCSRAVVAGLPQARGLAKRLIALGLTPGAEVRVLQNWGHCPLIIETRGARLALGRGQAARITVEVLPDSEGDASCPAEEILSGNG